MKGSTRNILFRKVLSSHKPERNPMELITNVTEKFPASKCQPYTSGLCVRDMVRDNTRKLVVGPMPDWLFGVPAGLPCAGVGVGVGVAAGAASPARRAPLPWVSFTSRPNQTYDCRQRATKPTLNNITLSHGTHTHTTLT